MSVGMLEERKERPAQIEFYREAVENKAESIRQGRYVATDVDMVKVFIPYSKDLNRFKVSAWLDQLEYEAKNNRIPADWVTQYRRLYEAWRTGQELPLNGTPIKGWAMISPAKQETLIHYHILTVEDLANLNDDGARRVGMGALEMREMARTWIAQAGDRGPLTIELTALKAENALLRSNVEALEKSVNALLAAQQTPAPRINVEPDIGASDILPEPEPPPRKRKATDATI